MNIILVSDSLAKSRIVTVSQPQIILAVFGFVSAGFMFAFFTHWVTMKYAVDIKNPFIQSLISTLTQQQNQKAEDRPQRSYWYGGASGHQKVDG